MAICKLCNKNESFLKSGTPISGTGNVCENCRSHYSEIIKAINAGDKEKFAQLKRGFLERTQTTENLNTVDALLKNLDLKFEEAKQKRATDALEKAEREAQAEKERKEREIQAEKERIEKKRKQQVELKKEETIKSILVVTTEGIDGYKLSASRKLLSTVCGVSLDGPAWRGSYRYSIEKAKANAIEELRKQAYDNGFNAVVALKFEFISVTVQGYVQYFVSAYATGVKLIENES